MDLGVLIKHSTAWEGLGVTVHSLRSLCLEDPPKAFPAPTFTSAKCLCEATQT